MAILSPTAHSRYHSRIRMYDEIRARLWRRHHSRIRQASDLTGWLQLLATIDRVAQRVALRKARV